MLKDGIAQILISVSNLDKSARFFQDNFGMSVVAEYSLDAKTINQLWNCSPETTGNVIILKNDEQTTSKSHDGSTEEATSKPVQQ